MDPTRQLLRHTLATLAYRAAKPLRDAPESFCKFRPAENARTAVEILAHMGDLFDWALSAVQGQERWHSAKPQPWADETARFFASLAAFDAYLATDAAMHVSADTLFQAPIADALTHVGQLSLMRRLAEAPVRAENYLVAKIVVGSVGADQPAPVREF
ncbi:MAG TPA: hypothetical protein VFW44_07000 [Bryobacteraceae bacterium]|nr:hypothetical protein [Bryobacteraceae bacterium]